MLRAEVLRVPGWGAVLLFCVLGCASSSESAPDVDVLREAVVGGETVEACEWPSTVSVNAWGACTGTLIHPRVITTAAHCIKGGRAAIYFGASRSTPGAFNLEARCEVGAEGSRGANTSRDWAYCVLPEDERVQQIPITPPLVGCEAERYLQAGVDAWVVGYGTTSPLGGGAGTKRQVGVKVNALNKVAPGTIDVGDAEVGACHGDSGGPLYVHLKDGEHDWGYRVVGSTSGAGAKGCDCNCSTVYVNIANHVKAIEEREDFDVTPCTDAEGAFDPSPACAELLTGPQTGAGEFPSCMVKRTSEPINSCGVLDASAHAFAAGSGAAALPDLTQAAELASNPAAAFQPVAGSGANSKPVRPTTGSATFSSMAAAGGVSVSSATTSGGCNIAAAGGQRSAAWAMCVCAFALWRRRRW